MDNFKALRDRFFEGLPRYRPSGLLGRGGMGAVFSALDLELDETIAIKVLAAVFQDDPESLLQRFKREISLARRIKHPNVARLYDFGMSAGFPFITMELVPGKDLSRRLSEQGPFLPLRAVSVLRQVCLGTAAAHREGIVHRDLKPQNVMADDEDGVAILDFGMARDQVRTGAGLTLRGTAMGTPQYMSPEQARGKPADARSDIYAIGVIAFEMLTGRVPFDGESPLEITTKHVHEPLSLAPLLEKEVPPRLVDVIARCLEKNPEARFASAADLEAALAVLAGFSEVRRTLRASTLPPDLELVLPGAGAPVPWDEPGPARILVVDDEPMVRDLIDIYLRQAGHETITAATGQEALERVYEGRVDLVLLDVMMPVMDGFDTIRVLRAQPRFEKLPIVLMSSFLERSRFAFAMQSGATDFLAKPLEMGQLVQKVNALLASRRAKERNR